jgi:hypothetical protein
MEEQKTLDRRMEVLETFPDGGRKVRDNGSGVATNICPFLYKDSPCASPVDELWAMSCPDNYPSCERYKSLTEETN